ncbi:LLM class flavin-dependent oxidoreductase [Amycolatopsis alkalitolerans]|uniref:LLM class flavin-dependent oxidoreductase n=1 Tax=Amycolatopsis alkalitolerans TaxID=2547244 RepID=A0A5C4LZ00_9PSEU|nr:LLM class flavin-dependent oxidoreductase [Amycolatopsis alkalitolerans]TNC25076.1 LLM class flavin-dependent oxidoreductase [Amycolatopsis alkalitolerans]
MVDIPSQEGTDDPRPVKVGVLLDQAPDKLTEWLADAAAFDAGGADALWVDCGPDPRLDVPALAAALAVVTYRVRLVVALPDETAAAPGLAGTIDTIVRLSRGRLALIAGPGALEVGVAVFRRVPGEPNAFECADEGERWVAVPVPQGRQSWRETRADVAGRGFTGLVVPADPQLLDMLRNPDDPGDRRDLQLAQG